MNEKGTVKIEEEVVLSKYEGDGTDPDTEFERLTIRNGIVVGHDRIEKQKVLGPVGKDNLEGKYVGTMLQNTKEVN
jgi:hypothetical protein